MNRATLSELNSAKTHFLSIAHSLKRLARDKHQRNPLVFVVASVFIGYLSNLVHNKDGTAKQYQHFVVSYLSKINHRYRTFVYHFANKATTQDLPLQMYHVLRCGVAHSYSLVPNQRGVNAGGRIRSIMLAHKIAQTPHLSHVTHNNQPACVFVAESFAADIEKTLVLVFRQARRNAALAKRMMSWMQKHPPIRGDKSITSQRPR